MSRLALIASYCASAYLSHGALASLRGRRRPPHDGMRRMGRPNLSGDLAADERQDQRALRTHPTRRPREDIFLPKQNRYLLDGGSPAFSAAASGNRKDRGVVLAPPELATIDPHP